MKFSYEQKERVKEMRVVVIGCGSIGSHVTVALARLGVKKFILIDDDKVEEKNVRNQVFLKHQVGLEKVEALGMMIEAIDSRIDWVPMPRKFQQVAPLIRWDDVDLIIEATDSSGQKREIWKALDLMGVLWVGCNGTAGIDPLIEIKRAANGWIVGDMKSEANVDNWGVAPKIMIISGTMVCLAVEKYLNG